MHDEKANVLGKSVWAGVTVVNGDSEISKATAASQTEERARGVTCASLHLATIA